MTRESKLAIIVGFAVVLVVAALISDHFSHARQARIGNDLAAGSAADFGASVPGLSAPIGKTETIAISEPPLADPMTRIADRGVAGPVGPAKADKPQAADEIRMGVPKAGFDAPEKAGEPERPYTEPSPVGPGSTRPDDYKQMIAGDLPVSDKKAKSYKVQQSDSLYKIAKVSYGDGTLWPELAEFNKSIVKDGAVVRAGDMLVLPPKEVLLGKARLADEAAAAGANETRRDIADNKTKAVTPGEKNVRDAGRSVVMNNPQRPKPPAKTEKKIEPAATKYVTYTVRRGDHLSTIAQKVLGSSRRMDEILKLNPSLDDEDSITEGVVLKLPKS